MTGRVAQLLGLIAWLAASLVVAALGALSTQDAPEFYAALDRPSWAPPASWFGPVWSALYLLMAVAAWLVWRAPVAAGKEVALLLFGAQLALNALWTWLFFTWRLGALAFVDAAALFALIAATLAYFWRVSRLAGALLVPYLAWVGFACALTWSVWQANPALWR